MAVRVFVGFLFAIFSISAQSGRARIQGQIIYPAGSVPADVSAELYDAAGSLRTLGKAAISKEGQFSFEQVPVTHTYLVRVLSASGTVVGEQIVDPVEGQGKVQVKVGAADDVLRLTGTISIMELSHRVPRAAMKEAREADNALKRRDFDGLVRHLEKVVALDPGFIVARRNLSLAYLKISQYEKAVDSFQILARMDPHSALSYAGLGTSFFNLNRLADSETAARRALEMDSSYELGHFLLGTTLAAQFKDSQLALRHLAKAVGHFPVAYLTAAGILARQGNHSGAKKQIEAYFDTGEMTSRAEAEDLLMLLN